MNFRFYCLFLLCFSQAHEIYKQINLCRYNPTAYANSRGIHIACGENLLQGQLKPLNVSENLERASKFQAQTVSSAECLHVSHLTCDVYCHQFMSCSFEDRLLHFMQNVSYSSAQEVLVLGPKRVARVVQLLLEKQGHCGILLNPLLNAFGASTVQGAKTVTVVSFAYELS